MKLKTGDHPLRLLVHCSSNHFSSIFKQFVPFQEILILFVTIGAYYPALVTFPAEAELGAAANGIGRSGTFRPVIREPLPVVRYSIWGHLYYNAIYRVSILNSRRNIVNYNKNKTRVKLENFFVLKIIKTRSTVKDRAISFLVSLKQNS